MSNARARRPDKAASTGVDRWVSVDKSTAVWTSLKRIFGMRWVDFFGAEPSDEWQEVLNRLSQKQLDFAINHVRDTAPPYSGWLPSLAEFQALARQLKLPKASAIEDVSPKGTWIDGTCALAAIRFGHQHGLQTTVWDAMKPIFQTVAATYNLIWEGDKTLTKEEVREATEKKLAEWRATLPIESIASEGPSNSSMRSGPLIQVGLSISDSSSNRAKSG